MHWWAWLLPLWVLLWSQNSNEADVPPMTTLNETMALLPADRGQAGVWVFAYASLMWRPDFDHDEVRDGLMRGYHRGLCLYSHQYRGTPETPGLVFGLEPGR